MNTTTPTQKVLLFILNKRSYKSKSELAIYIKINYSHLCNIIKYLSKLDYVKEKMIGRNSYIEITNKGKKYINSF